MAGRTIAVGDIHGELEHLQKLWAKLPSLDAEDTLVFLGDYVDRGPDSRGVVEFMRALPLKTPAKIVLLCGNHEDGWLRVADGGFPEFILPEPNGCWPCARSFMGKPPGTLPEPADVESMMTASFFPPGVVDWMRAMPCWYEDDHAIYVHAGLAEKDGSFQHPSEVKNRLVLLWTRSKEFFQNYRGKRVICGHTATEDLPQDLSLYTPDDPSDLWFTQHVIAIGTKCGKTNGFLTALELPSLHVYESR
jgi:serine/threonine protein phosphatase 1